MMRTRERNRPNSGRVNSRQRGSVLIIVLWVAFGLVSIALYFAQSMTFELRAADNRVASLEAEQTIDGAARYIHYLLTNLGTNGTLPDVATYQSEGVTVGTATFWIIGRGADPASLNGPAFGLVDEAAKLNLNTATLEMLQLLPRMTPGLAAAIIDWRDADSTVSQGGAESETYQRRQPAYNCKNAPFETVDELRLVSGADLDILYGEDSNRNGVLDPNENDSTTALPNDNRDGRLDAGILEYVTVSSRQPNARTNVNNAQQLASLLQQKFSAEKANQILRVPGAAVGNRSTLEFYIKVKDRLTADEFAQIANDITTTNSPYVEGLINVNTASAEVLACIPGIGTDKAASLVSYRQSNPDKLTSVAWVAEVLDRNGSIQAGRYLTTQSYQLTADIAAVGHFGRGYSRTRFVFDTSEGSPKIRNRQDLTGLGWALGSAARQKLLLAKETR